jgi:hypothetical protein
MTTQYEIIAAWIDSCQTTLQMDTVIDFIQNRLKTDQKTADDLADYWNRRNGHRSWVAAKVAQRDYTDVSNNRLPVCDEYNENQPSDIS